MDPEETQINYGFASAPKAAAMVLVLSRHGYGRKDTFEVMRGSLSDGQAGDFWVINAPEISQQKRIGASYFIQGYMSGFRAGKK